MSSLTAPWDRTTESEKYIPKQITLTESEVKEAMDTLVHKEFVEKFPRVDKFYADPVMNSEIYCLHSFVHTKGAKPDENGVYGFVKFRGVFPTLREADERSEYIIRNVDSFHEIYTSYCGRPFPLTHNKNFVKETREIDIKDQLVKAVSEDVKAKVMKDKEIKEQIKEREKKLLEESITGEPPEDRYITAQVKRANLVHVYVETRKSLEKIKESILKCREEINQLDKESPQFKEEYIEKYNNARKESGLESYKDTTYLQYMGLNDEEILGF